MAVALGNIGVTVPDGTGTLTILDGVSIEIAEGESVALSGASGSGKSTLLAVAGLLRTPDTGTVTIAGVEAGELGNSARTRLRRDTIGIVYQTPNLFPALTALQQVEIAAHVAGRLDEDARLRARELLVEVGLEKRLGARPAELSGGERQRVGIARALMNEPSLLLADEPTASLDPERGQAVMDLLLEQARMRDAATLIVTHDPDQTAAVARHVRIESARLHEVALEPTG